MSALARWCYRRRLAVVLFWLAVLAGLGVASQSVGTSYSTDLALPGTESRTALELLQRTSPAESGSTATVVWQAERGSVRDAAVRQEMTAALDRIAGLPGVGDVRGPYAPEGAGQVSRDGRTAYAHVAFGAQTEALDPDDVQRVVDTAREGAADGVRVELGGPAVTRISEPGTHTAELIGVIAAAVVLFLAFGSLLAMAVPLVTAIAGIGTAILTMGLLSNAFTLADLSPTLGTLIGLGVGIDYALFIVTRHRAGLKAGRGVEESIVAAVHTSGRAVLFAAGTVVVSLLGMLVLGLSFLNGVAITAAMTVGLTAVASVTLLPALLGLLGTRTLSRRERRALAAHGPVAEDGATGLWARWAATVRRRPRALSAVALLVMVVLTVPVFGMRLGSSDQGNDPESSTTRAAYDLLAEGFGPGFNGPLYLVAEVPGAAERAALGALADRVRGAEGVAGVTALPIPDGAAVGVVEVVPDSSPQSPRTSELIERLRADEVPAAEDGTGLRVHVGGETAVNDDFADVLAGRMPLFVGVIVALGFLLLLAAFRSLLVPATAAVMNLFAAGASIGVIVALFQWGWASEPLGLGTGPVETFLPVLMLPVLFGLSMDYQVFLVSRMHEEWTRHRDNGRAVIVGQAATGRVITAAAAIMIAVFGAFMLGGERVLAEFGAGLAAAVALDAFILRTVLVPAVMHLFGPANWWLPRWLDARLPHLSIDPPAAPAAAPRKEVEPQAQS
ncbi:MMPL family transporter [Actinomadura sp. WMMB 499]|uniref:MMPL family transporter n=1 Tax=Actinomadura sp. WMMB 499 TaxID=1219491 RepID=UPI00124926B3|nr:MMPL family transporter [Actinomadura sp. WMMB 499]QFG24501.1 MMPL family transporter [Actinomadura sp. WMMB 499]